MNWEQANRILDERRDKALLGGGEAKIEKQHNSGKLTARERLELLFDKGTFVETDAFIESRINDFDLDKRRVPGDGVVTGYGYVDGRLVFAASEDFTVIGGTLGEYHSMKICRIQDMAMEMKAPLICINDSGGARIEEGISSLSGYAGMFLRHTKASGVIPQIAVILGPCSGGACYAPAICDFIFMVNETSKMFITGPNVVKTVINEETTVEDIVFESETSKGSFYHYFKGKDELMGTLANVFDEKYEELMETMDPVLGAVEKLIYLNHELFAMIDGGVSIDLLARLLSTQLLARGEKHLLDRNRTYFRLLRQIIAAGQQAGELRTDRTVNDIVKAYALWERALLYDWCLCGGEYSLTAYTDSVTPMFLESYRAEAAGLAAKTV